MMNFIRKQFHFRMLTWILLTLFLSLAVFIVGFGYYLSAPGYRGAKSDHFNGEKFINLVPLNREKGRSFLRWTMQRKAKPWLKWVENPKFSRPRDTVTGEQWRVTFINHATVLIEMDGFNILTDPIWSERCSPVTWAGPKRHHAPGLSFEDLPKIDLVLLSHNHYDHFDLPTLQKLNEKHHPQFLTGLANKTLLEKSGIQNVTEMDWWQSKKITEQITAHFTPAQHFSGRGLYDHNKSLWGGFVLQSPHGQLYFAGDTAWSPHFAEINKRFGKMRLALLPIGAYEPRSFMKAVHVNPEEALQAHKILQAQTSVSIHFGTFRLSDEGQYGPVLDLLAALEKEHISLKDFWVLQPGENRLVK